MKYLIHKTISHGHRPHYKSLFDLSTLNVNNKIVYISIKTPNQLDQQSNIHEILFIFCQCDFAK